MRCPAEELTLAAQQNRRAQVCCLRAVVLLRVLGQQAWFASTAADSVLCSGSTTAAAGASSHGEAPRFERSMERPRRVPRRSPGAAARRCCRRSRLAAAAVATGSPTPPHPTPHLSRKPTPQLRRMNSAATWPTMKPSLHLWKLCCWVSLAAFALPAICLGCRDNDCPCSSKSRGC